jgi:hypothetical protein
VSERKRDDRHGDPALPEDGWYGLGEEAIWAVDFTEGGAPHGPIRAELRVASERMDSGVPWARAKSFLRLAMSTLSLAIEGARAQRHTERKDSVFSGSLRYWIWFRKRVSAGSPSRW